MVVRTRTELPVDEMLKINIDVSFLPDSREGAWGFVIGDNTSDVVSLGAGKMQYLQDAMQVEAEACLQAIQAAQNWGMTRIIIETNAQELMRAVT